MSLKAGKNMHGTHLIESQRLSTQPADAGEVERAFRAGYAAPFNFDDADDAWQEYITTLKGPTDADV